MAKPIRRVRSDSRPPPIEVDIVPHYIERERILSQDDINRLYNPDRDYVDHRNESLDAALKLERDIQQIKINIITFMKKYLDENIDKIVISKNNPIKNNKELEL